MFTIPIYEVYMIRMPSKILELQFTSSADQGHARAIPVCWQSGAQPADHAEEASLFA